MVMVPHCVPARSPRTRRSLSLAASVDMHAPFQLGEGKPSAATDYVSPTNLYETPPPGHVVIDMTGSLSGVSPSLATVSLLVSESMSQSLAQTMSWRRHLGGSLPSS